MKRTPFLFLVPLFFLLLSCNGSPTDPFGGDGATLFGTVKDRYGAVTCCTNIALLDADGDIAETTMSDDSGRYSMHNVRPGSYRLHARLGRHAISGHDAQIEILPGRNLYDFTVP